MVTLEIRHCADLQSAFGIAFSHTVQQSSSDRNGVIMIEKLSDMGIKSQYAYTAGFLSIGASLVSWTTSRGKSGDSKAQADRWGIFIGHWAPTFFAIGIALQLTEEN